MSYLYLTGISLLNHPKTVTKHITLQLTVNDMLGASWGVTVLITLWGTVNDFDFMVAAAVI